MYYNEGDGEVMDRNLALELVRVTEAAALVSSQFMEGEIKMVPMVQL